MTIIDINDSQRTCVSVTPDPAYPGFVRVEFKNHHEWYTVKEFLDKNPSLKHLIVHAPKVPNDTLGVVSSATQNTLKDVTQRWDENTYLGFTAWISRGHGEGQQRIVVSNTHNTITVDKRWDVKPDTSSQYVLSHNTHTMLPQGNTLPSEDIKKLEELSQKMDLERGIVRPKSYYHPSAKKTKKKKVVS